MRRLSRALLLSALLVLLPSGAAAGSAGTCSALGAVPDAVQVAWVSPVQKTVGARSWLDVVRVADMRAFLGAKGVTPIRLLQGLGLVNARGKGRAAKKDYKVTIFDVRSAWLCRPMGGDAADRVVEGVAVCAGQRNAPRRAYTGCGYTKDTAATTKDKVGRGFDVYKVRWRDASSGGFCVMPLERFMKGA